MTAFYWSKAYPGHYYLYAEPRREGAVGHRAVVGEVERDGTQNYTADFGYQHHSLHFEGRSSPVSRMRHLEDCIRNLIPEASFTKEF